jgi:hypothetical protein
VGRDLNYDPLHCKVKFCGKWDKGQKKILTDKAIKYRYDNSLIHNLNERQYGMESHTFALNYRMYQFVPLCYWTSKV